MKIFEPEYYRKFRCLGASCPDNCCTGWNVVVDKTTYEKYRHLPPGPLQESFMQRIKVDPSSTSEHRYATVELDGDVCPFWDGNCRIQEAFGENYLSNTCATFPRAKNLVDGVLEQSLDLACPEAARLMLSSRDKMAFILTDSNISYGNVVSTLSTSADSKPYSHFHLIRSFVIDLLQNREYPLWQRLIILGFIIKRLDELVAGDYGAIPMLLKSSTDNIKTGVYIQLLDDFAPDPELQLQVTAILLNHRLREPRCPGRFSLLCNKVFSGIGYETEPFSVSVNHYRKSYDAYYRPFMENHEYILENYLVNYVYKALFPLGPTTSMYKGESSLYAEYILLICHFALIKTLLIGFAGLTAGAFGPDEAIDIIQSYAKAMEHYLDYQKKLVRFIEVSNMANNAALALFIKN